MDYRRDTRSPEEFAHDIKRHHTTEGRLMVRYVDWLNSRSDKKGVYTYVDNGVDNTGTLIKEDRAVTAKADFLLKRIGIKDRLIEIKHCGPERDKFHFKESHVKRCIKDDICIINFMAVETPNPKFCIITPDVLKDYIKNHRPVYFWNKSCYCLHCKDFLWHSIKLS